MKKLFVGNLSFQATEEDVQNWFAEIGVTPQNITLVRDRFSGQPRGFGFVEIESDDDAARAAHALDDVPGVVRRRHGIVCAGDDERRRMNATERVPLVHVAHRRAARDVSLRR